MNYLCSGEIAVCCLDVALSRLWASTCTWSTGTILVEKETQLTVESVRPVIGWPVQDRQHVLGWASHTSVTPLHWITSVLWIRWMKTFQMVAGLREQPSPDAKGEEHVSRLRHKGESKNAHWRNKCTVLLEAAFLLCMLYILQSHLSLGKSLFRSAQSRKS